MERALLAIVALVFIVAFVGFFLVLPKTEVGAIIAGDDLAGNVVKDGGSAGGADACASCTGTPVCAGKDGKAVNYPSACAATCDSARILYDDVCEQIPRNH